MSSTILSLLAEGESEIRDTDCVGTSFPDFTRLLNDLLPGSVYEVRPR